MRALILADRRIDGAWSWVVAGAAFVLLFVLFFFTYVLAPFFSPWFLLSIYVLKASTDRLSRFPFWVSLLAPVSYLLSPFLQLDSAFNHWTGRVSWKGRRVGKDSKSA